VEYVSRTAGASHVLHVTASSPVQAKHFMQLFDRTQRYESLIKTIESLRVGFGQTDPGGISRVLHKQRREFEAIAALDFFPTAVRTRTMQALVDADKAVRDLLFSSTQTRAVLKAQEVLRGRAWATRKPLWADRLACAWLIRRFVDPEGTLTWLDKADALPQDTIGFAFDGAHFMNTGTRVAYEEMLARLDLLKNGALTRIGNIVHYLEVQGDPVPEALGVQTLLQGAVRRSTNENELLAEVEKTFDLLYDAYFDPQKR
jgi:hypothetical protein